MYGMDAELQYIREIRRNKTLNFATLNETANLKCQTQTLAKRKGKPTKIY